MILVRGLEGSVRPTTLKVRGMISGELGSQLISQNLYASPWRMGVMIRPPSNMNVS